MRLTVTQPSLAPSKAFVQRHLRPLSFVLTPVLDTGGFIGGEEGQVRLVTPFRDTLPPLAEISWLDLHSGKPCGGTTTGEPGPGLVRLKSLGQVILEYLRKPEAKSAAADGTRCTRTSLGILRRLHIKATSVVYTGKEVSGKELSMEAPDGGPAKILGQPVRDDLGELRDELARLPSLKAFARDSGIPLRTIQTIKAPGSRPRSGTVLRVRRALRNR